MTRPQGPVRLDWDRPAPADLHDHLHPKEPAVTCCCITKPDGPFCAACADADHDHCPDRRI